MPIHREDWCLIDATGKNALSIIIFKNQRPGLLVLYVYAKLTLETMKLPIAALLVGSISAFSMDMKGSKYSISPAMTKIISSTRNLSHRSLPVVALSFCRLWH